MTLKEAAIQVLMEAEGPLHAKEVAKRILAHGLWETAGKTPDATVSAQLYTDIKKNGDQSLFIQAGP
jgi:restriction system protein